MIFCQRMQARRTRDICIEPTVGYMPECFMQAALGHNDKAIHRAYVKQAEIIVTSFVEYELKASLRKWRDGRFHAVFSAFFPL
jgi:hypothetical protein